MVSSKLKKILEENKDLINSNNFKKLYDKISDPLLIGELTYVLYKSGINPLKYMDKIPFYFFYEIAVPDDFVIPENIKQIMPHAFTNARIDSIYIPDSVKSIRGIAFFGSDLRSISLSENIYLSPDCLDGLRWLQTIYIRSDKSWAEIRSGMTKAYFLKNVGASSLVKIVIRRGA